MQPYKRKENAIPIGVLVRHSMKHISFSGGFPIAGLILNWRTIVGQKVGQISTPVAVTKPQRNAFESVSSAGKAGSVLRVLVQSAYTQIVHMQTPAIIKKINAYYGYQAITKIQIQQMSRYRSARGGYGFAEAKQGFSMPTAPAVVPSLASDCSPAVPPCLSNAQQQSLHTWTADIKSDRLRLALQRLGESIFTEQNKTKSTGGG